MNDLSTFQIHLVVSQMSVEKINNFLSRLFGITCCCSWMSYVVLHWAGQSVKPIHTVTSAYFTYVRWNFDL